MQLGPELYEGLHERALLMREQFRDAVATGDREELQVLHADLQVGHSSCIPFAWAGFTGPELSEDSGSRGKARRLCITTEDHCLSI